MNIVRICVLAALVVVCSAAVGIFERDADVGDTPKTGAIEFNADTGNYRVTGGGDNIWAKVDAFHFAWRQISGDVVVTADVKFVGTGAVDHRKAVLMIAKIWIVTRRTPTWLFMATA